MHLQLLSSTCIPLAPPHSAVVFTLRLCRPANIYVLSTGILCTCVLLQLAPLSSSSLGANKMPLVVNVSGHLAYI
jgi:hypothetical protein